MISNMRHQLKIVGKEHLMEAALEEAGQVRKDFGYPIMVTPLSQFVGTQAAINVIVGERYKEVPDQNIQYALGIWGKEAVDVMDPNVRDKILNRPRAKEWTHWEQPEPTLHEIRQKYGAQLSDEDLILHYFAGEEYVKALPNHGRPSEYLDATQPLVKIIEQLAKRKDSNQVYIKQPGFHGANGKTRDALARRTSDFLISNDLNGLNDWNVWNRRRTAAAKDHPPRMPRQAPND